MEGCLDRELCDPGMAGLRVGRWRLRRWSQACGGAGGEAGARLCRPYGVSRVGGV